MYRLTGFDTCEWQSRKLTSEGKWPNLGVDLVIASYRLLMSDEEKATCSTQPTKLEVKLFKGFISRSKVHYSKLMIQCLGKHTASADALNGIKSECSKTKQVSDVDSEMYLLREAIHILSWTPSCNIFALSCAGCRLLPVLPCFLCALTLRVPRCIEKFVFFPRKVQKNSKFGLSKAKPFCNHVIRIHSLGSRNEWLRACLCCLVVSQA